MKPMKKIYLMTLLLAVSCWLSAQTFIYEDFSAGSMPPAGWTIDAYSSNWSAGASANAGGAAPEAVFFYSPAFNNTSRLISPAIDMTGYTSVKLMFKHFLDDYDGSGYSLGVATRSGGGAWNIAWSVNPTGDIGPEEKLVDIETADVGASDFQFCIYFSGNSYNLDYWYIDDIMLFLPYELDGALAKISMPTYVGGAVPVEGEFRNLGNETIVTVDVSWKVSDDMVYTTTFNSLLYFGESFSFSCDDLFHFPIGGYTLDVWISAVNGMPDDNPDNNLKSKMMSVYSHSIYRKPAFEEFTSSTCAPCASFNTSFNPWAASHADEITLIKYQMNWPSPGDPYYTAEGGVRRNYYGVSYVPWPQCNGAYVDYTIGAVQAAFNNAILQPGIAKIASSHTISGTEITVNANILPFADFTDFRAHIIVIENMTTGNTGNNGETQFHHVMMKMMPNANGTTLNLNDRETVTLTETFNLSGTNIEEFDDLSVVVLFQDYGTKEVFQSEYSIESGVFNTEASCAEITYNGMPVPGFVPDVYDYEIELPVGTTEVPVVTGTAADPYATMVVVPAWELPGTTVVDVFGEDLLSRMTYSINFSVAVGMDEPGVNNNIRIFPNPANDRIYVQGTGKADVRIFSITGQLVLASNGSNADYLDVSSLDNGIYTVQVVMEDNTVVNKKVTVLR
jgi:hypothetical protein